MTTRRAVIAALPGLLIASSGHGQSQAWASLKTSGHFALIRHALAPGTFDPPGFRLDNCSTQRNLSAEGRAQATRIGDLFRTNGISTTRLYSSQWCRCLETAGLMKLGDVVPQPFLNSFAQNRESAEQQLSALRPWIAGLDLQGPTVFVTHQVVITALSDVFPGSGEIVAMRRDAGGRLTLQGRIATS